jgi:virginiamycin B lyase
MDLVTRRFELVARLAAAVLCCVIAGCGGGGPGSPLTPSGAGANGADTLSEARGHSTTGLQVFALAPNSDPSGVLADGGTVWYNAQSSVGSVTKAGHITEYPSGGFATGTTSFGTPTVGADGNIWFVGQIGSSAQGTSFIGHTTSTGGVVQFPISTPGPGPGYADPCLGGIAAGSDGALWFTNGCAGYIGRITTSGTVTAEYPTSAACANVSGIVAGPDHDLWFTSACGIGRIVPASGAISEFPTGSGYPYRIVSAYDALWFAYTTLPEGPGVNPTTGLGRMTKKGVVATYPLPLGQESIAGLAPGPDDDIWFTVAGSDALYSLTQSGAIGPEVIVGASPRGLVSLSSKNIWFADGGADAIDAYTF